MGILIEKMNKNLLTIKIILESKSLRDKVLIWYTQISRGIKNILIMARTGLKDIKKIEHKEKYRQLELKI